MGRRVRSLWPFVAGGAIAMVTVAGLAAVWWSPHRGELEGFAELAISAAGIAAGWIAWVWRARSQQASVVVSGQEFGQLADLLAGVVDVEWTRAAGERGLLEPEPIAVRWQRPAAPFAGPTGAAVSSTRFAPLPGLAAAGQQRLRAGRVSELHEVYGGLGSGRLVIAGGPGSGKSSAAVLLILAALRYRQSVHEKARPEVPVPVMFTLHGWDPGTQRARDWLAERLGQTYPLFAGKQRARAARGMLDQGRIAVILDGLDEIPEDLRPVVLRALSQQATFRLVLLTRSAEMAAAAARAMLQGAAAIELQDIDPGAAAGYLTRTQLDPPPHGWQDLTRRLRQEPGSPLARALSNPLMLTLVRDTYRAGDDAGELLGLRDAAGHPASSEDIIGHLLDRVLPAAYTRQPGEPAPRYDLPTAERALQCIAARMNNDGTRDLQWWHVPAWAHAAPRVSATCLVAGIVTEVSAWTYFGVNAHFLDATMYYLTALAATLVVAFGIASVRWRQLFRRRLLMVGLLAGLLAGAYAELDSARFLTELVAALVVAFGLLFGRGDKVPKRIASVRWRQLFRRRPLVVGLLTGLLAGTYAKLNPPLGYPAALAAGLAAGLVAWLGAGLVAGMSRPGADSTSPLTPLASWRSDRAFGLAAGLVSGLAAGLAPGLLFGVINGIEFGEFGAGLHEGLQTALRYGLVVGFGVGIAYSQSWPSALTFAQLAMSDRIPFRLMRFLEDAHSRSVLRTVGPVYQFRHARLQDRLADQERQLGRGISEPHPTTEEATAPAAKALQVP